jgi:quercetin dioxygenase-like cupin family protein
MTVKKSQTKSKPANPVALEPGAALSDETAVLAFASPVAVAPSAAVKARLMARIRAAQTPAHGTPEVAPAVAGWRFDSVRDKAGWFALPVPGVRMKQLSVDPARDVMQMLVEIAPGARFPDHDHIAGDEAILLSGDVFSGGRLLRAGDYYHASAGTRHTDIVSPSGCVALVSFPVTAWKIWKAEMMAAARKS